ncbi:MAG: hypothetical protein ACFE89_04440 [Candidatus Hodarchaeota archaeon]
MSKLKETDFKSLLAFSLARQFWGIWGMTRQAIAQIPDSEWPHGVEVDHEWFYSLRVYHLIETIEFYSKDTPKGMQWGARLGTVNWWETISHKEAAERITKATATAYMNEIAEHLDKHLRSVTDEELMGKDEFHWFASVLEKFQYVIRHSSFHLGELAMYLRDQSCERMKWS